jgi:carboxylate-amine ligase
LAQLQEQLPVDTADAERAFHHARHLLRQGTHADQQLQCLAQASAAGLGRAQALRAVVAAGACN